MPATLLDARPRVDGKGDCQLAAFSIQGHSEGISILYADSLIEVVVMIVVIGPIAHHVGQERGVSMVQLVVWDEIWV